MRKSSLYCAITMLLGCMEIMAPISNKATPCQHHGDCLDRFFCSDGLCLRSRTDKCGDGRVQTGRGEVCDDGNRRENDGCRGNCQAARCGDGVLRTDLTANEEGYEGCDDGTVDDTDACLNNCQIARCGDGVIRLDQADNSPEFEACDDGNTNSADACLNNCRQARCGDGVVRLGLSADDPNFEACDSTDDCTNQCRVARCGDGLVQAESNETCDDGNQVNDDACTNQCQIAVCGDGIKRQDVEPSSDQFEFCDDGNALNDDDCVGNCRIAQCGDGLVRRGVERCDDGNSDDTDACNNTCNAHYIGLSAGQFFTCGLLATGHVRCWGANNAQQLGHHGDGGAIPHLLTQTSQVTRLHSYDAFTCAFQANEQMKCWGSYLYTDASPIGAGIRWREFLGCPWMQGCQFLDDSGRLWGTSAFRTLTPFQNYYERASSCGRGRCFSNEEGVMECWWYSSPGPPERLEQVSDFIVQFGGEEGNTTGDASGHCYVCARRTDGSVNCWGEPPVEGLWSEDQQTPVAGLEHVRRLWQGGASAYATLESGELVSINRIGCADDAPAGRPCVVPGIRNPIAVAGGQEHGCALDAEHELHCWGSNEFGQLGPAGP